MEISPWYSYSIKDILEKFGSSPSGISNSDAKRRLKKFGLNKISSVAAPQKKGLAEFFGFSKSPQQESNETIKKLLREKAKIIRLNKEIEINFRYITLGDIVELEKGAVAPGDMRLLNASDLKIDENILFGTDEPVEKELCRLIKDKPLSECKNMVFAGTKVVEGKGLGIVVAAGNNTLIAKKIHEHINAKRIEDINLWYTFAKEKVIEKIKTDSEKGLAREDAKKRLIEFGENKLPEEKKTSKLALLLTQFSDPLIYILVIAAVIAFILKEYTDAIVIMLAVLINTIIGFIQENKANEALSALKKILKIKAKVVRDGEIQEIFQQQIVPGDIVMFDPGDKVPADCYLLESENLHINEASLTGESMPVEKNTGKLKENVILADRTNMAYMGTSIEAGHAKAIVVGTGLDTEIGKIASILKETTEEKTPFQEKLFKFSKLLGIIIIVISLIIFIVGILEGQQFVEMLTTSIAVAVAAIPEGLPIAITVIFAIGMHRILKRKGLVRRMVSAETLGATSVICSDKTGTLTEAKMQLTSITEPENYKTYELNNLKEGDIKIIFNILKIAALRSEAYIENELEEKEKWVIEGRPTDKAITAAAVKFNIVKSEIVKKERLLDELPFGSDNKYSASIHKTSGDKNIIYAMGAPEMIYKMSNWVESGEKKEKITSRKIKDLTEEQTKLTSSGLRVLAVAYKNTIHEKIDKAGLSNLIFVGFISLKDPLRKTAKDAIKTCQDAGITPVIITGDHRLTAKAIAQEIGLACKECNILEGAELEKMTDSELVDKVNDIAIYARTEPVQKLRIIKAWQQKGKVIAMTGDGVNDAPALKQANIGIALGSGTDVAKEVSDLVLLADDFSVVVAAVEEGRGIIDNIRKVMTYLLSGTFTELILIGGSLIFGFPLPILAAQILWVNLIEDSFPNIALSFEEKEKDLMRQKPEQKDIPLLTKEMKILIFVIGVVTDLFLLGLFFWFLNYSGYPIGQIRSIMFVGLCIDSLFYVFACKSLRRNIWNINIFSNMWLVLSWIVGIILLVGALYLPPLQTLLKTHPIGLNDWLLLGGLGLAKLALIELVKFYYIRKGMHKA